MGIVDTITGILTSWRGQKRKRTKDDEDGDEKVPSKQICTYILTPTEKYRNSDVMYQRTHDNAYVYDEEIRTTESRQYEFKAGGVLFGGNNLNQEPLKLAKTGRIHCKLDQYIVEDLPLLVRKYASAFFNSEGGVLLAGVNDNGIVKGITVSNRDKDMIWQTTRNEISQFRPTISPSLWNITFVPVTFKNNKRPIFNQNDRFVVEFSFKKGNDEDVYETATHEVFLRRDGGVQGPLRPLDIKNLVISKYNGTLAQRKIKKEEEERRKKRMQEKGIKYIVID